MDAFELLKKDHQKVSQLFEKIESANGNSKTGLFSQLKAELDLHALVEEKYLYPALENKEPARDITLEAYEEHKVVKDLLAELATGAPGDEWDAKLTVLKENVEHHVEEEEGELFSKARDVLGNEQIDVMGAEMEAEKAAQGKPPANPNATRKAVSKSKSTTKTAESPGVLTRLANFVGLGSGTATRKSGKAAKKKAPAKKAPAKKAAPSKKAAGKKKSGRATGTAAKKSAASTTSKKAGTKKASKTSSKAAKKSAPARKAAGKKAPARKK